MLRPRLLVLVCIGGLLHLGAVMVGAVVLHDRLVGGDDIDRAIVEDGEEDPVLTSDGVLRVGELDDTDEDDATDEATEVELADETADASDVTVVTGPFERGVVLPVDIVVTTR